jgi:hypothetical protein
MKCPLANSWPCCPMSARLTTLKSRWTRPLMASAVIWNGPDLLVAAVGHITAAARRAIMDGTAVLGRPARTGKRLTTSEKLDLLPPFEAAQLRSEWRAKKTIAEMERITRKIEAAYAHVTSAPAN